MSIIKERIKFENQDINLKINLGGGNKQLGYQQEINNLTEETKVELINPIIDNEVRRFRYGGSAISLFFYFSANGTTYVNDFGITGAKFSSTEINNYNVKILNSFFKMDFFDTFENFTQTKIFTIYQTQISDGEKSGDVPIPTYKINSNNPNQFYSWYVPKKFIDKNIETGTTSLIGYVKFSFYTAKYGKLRLFYNKANQSLKTPERMYFKVILDLVNMTWKFYDSGDKKAYQIPITNVYSQKVNNAMNNFNNKQQNFPNGNTFDTETGTYITE